MGYLPLDSAGPVPAGVGAGAGGVAAGAVAAGGGRSRRDDRVDGGGVPLLLGDDGDQEGQSLDETPNLRLDLGDQPPGHEPTGLCRDGPDQGYHGKAEALRRGKEWGVVHALFLRRTVPPGQAKK
jgi:hypothetical protein